MVRFIIKLKLLAIQHARIFTFHYGQIYYRRMILGNKLKKCIYIPLWLDLLYFRKVYALVPNLTFTFHYGQIYYYERAKNNNRRNNIYIPLWLDLLYYWIYFLLCWQGHLHSTMVRFIIPLLIKPKVVILPFTFHYGQIYYGGCRTSLSCCCFIYIPLWLDLLYFLGQVPLIHIRNLHSTMVRFIIFATKLTSVGYWRFTFHYGQIYYL